MNREVRLIGAQVPAGTERTLGKGQAELVLGNVYVQGHLQVLPGTRLKVAPPPGYSGYQAFNVVPGGVLDVNGELGAPVTITSYADDTIGGDTNGDGPSAGTRGDYETAINIPQGSSDPAAGRPQ